MSDLVKRWKTIRAEMDQSNTISFHAVRNQINETIDRIEKLEREKERLDISDKLGRAVIRERDQRIEELETELEKATNEVMTYMG